MLEGSGKDVFAGEQVAAGFGSRMHGFARRDGLMLV